MSNNIEGFPEFPAPPNSGGFPHAAGQAHRPQPAQHPQPPQPAQRTQPAAQTPQPVAPSAQSASAAVDGAVPKDDSLVSLLKALVVVAGSDLHLKAETAPRVRVDGVLRNLRVPQLTVPGVNKVIDEVLREDLREAWAEGKDVDFAVFVKGVGRFRVNAFRQQGKPAVVFRRVLIGAPDLATLGMPDSVRDLALKPRGLVLVTGPTGAGKTTTLAGMIDVINRERDVHVITVEDPIEIVHEEKRALVSQREVRVDTPNFLDALRSAMRQDPDVILVGEMRDTETVRTALQASETGHLVLSTLHTVNAQETLTRILDFFPPHEQQQVRFTLSQALRGIVCQRLVPRADGQGRIPAVEVCVNTPRISEAIADQDKNLMIEQLVAEGSLHGMQTFDQHIVQLVLENRISIPDALDSASKRHDVEVGLRRSGVIV